MSRAEILGRARKSTIIRYRPILDKFEKFCLDKRIGYWSQVDKAVVTLYIGQISEFAPYPQSLELMTIKQVVNFLIEEKYLPESCRIKLPVRRPRETTTYCWREEKVAVMLAHCATDPSLAPLGDIILFLAYTGLRISELTSLQWSDVNLEQGTIRVTDEGTTGPSIGRAKPLRTKSG